MLFFTSPVRAELSPNQAMSGFISAANHYTDGQYVEAIAEYQAILDGGWESGEVYYNLANSYFRSGQKGAAILNYERALRLMPRDSDLKFNVRFARASVPRSTPARSWVRRLIDGHIEFYTREEMVLIMTAMLVLCALAHIGAMFLRLPLTSARWIWGICGLVFVIYFTGFIVKVRHETGRAVLLAEAKARFEPRKEATVHYSLPEGGIVRVLREEFGWIKVRRPDGKLGWVPAGHLDLI